MITSEKPLLELTAEDLMSRDLLVFSEEMPLREAAQSLLRVQVAGAPVVDVNGKCVGVLSAFDYVRLFKARPEALQPAHGLRPMTCPFQARLGTANGREAVHCLLALGACPLQRPQKNAKGENLLLCEEPHCVLADWQVVELEQLAEDPVRQYMTPDPVTVSMGASIRELARTMIDAHIHRVVVVDEQQKPIGIVTSTDILAALAYAE